MTATASQAWAILKRHARDEIATLRLQDLCQDNDRVSSLVSVHNSGNSMLLVDLSRQRMTLETLNHLLKLSVTRGVRKYITRLAWGQNNPDTPLQITATNTNKPRRRSRQQLPVDETVMPSMHFALRAPKDQGLHMLTTDGVNALTAIHREWDRLERLSDGIRRGAWRGVSSSMIRDVVVVGRGVAIQALQFIDQALRHDETAIIASKFGLEATGSASSTMMDLSSRFLKRTSTTSRVRPRKMHFLTSVDPLAAAALVQELDAGSTLVISLALAGNEETGLATQTLKTWLLQQLGADPKRADSILSKHMLLVTGSDAIATSINKPESVFLIPEHSRCEAFISFSAATLLPLSIVYGWSICEQFLSGGHDLDCHFVETNPRHNLPVLLALTDVWNDAFMGTAGGRVVTPFALSLKGFPSFVAALEAQTCSGQNNNHNNLQCSSLVLDGGSDSAYDRALYQSPNIQNSEMIMVMNTQLKANAQRNLGAQGMDDVFHHADALMCSMFGHADELAFGRKDDNAYLHRTESLHEMMDGSQRMMDTTTQEGNRPSTLLLCGTLDAFCCGQLIALSEHRAAVKARIWDIDPFAREAGYALRTPRAEQLRQDLENIYLMQEMGGNDSDDDDDNDEESGGLNLSSKTILGHYARVRS